MRINLFNAFEKINNPIHLIISTDDNANGALKTFRNNLKYTFDGIEELFINYETTDFLNICSEIAAWDLLLSLKQNTINVKNIIL